MAQFIANNDEQAFEKLVCRYYRQIYQFVVRFTGQRELAEDVTQETFIKVHKAARTFDLGRKFRPWLFAIAANKARDTLRSAARTIRTISIQSNQPDERAPIDVLAAVSEAPDKALTERETAERVKRVLNTLPEKLREVLLLAYYERMPYKEITEVLDIPLGTVKSRLHKAVLSFGQIWKAKDTND